MKLDYRAAFAAIAIALASCQGGFDSGAGGMPGEMGPPVNGQGPLGSQGQLGNSVAGGSGGPTAGPNGIAELSNPGATLAPNQAQYPVADGPTGMKCPVVQQFECTFSFNVPNASPSPAPSGSPGKAKPTPSPTPTPTPTPEPSESSDENGEQPSPSPTPPGTITLQMEPLPSDVPSMTQPDLRALRVTALVGLRIQSDTDFVLNGTAIAEYTLPRTQIAGRSFVLQLYNESFQQRTRKRIDTFLGTYAKGTLQDQTVRFSFNVPKVTVRQNQIWLLVLYGLTYPPGTTPSPSPTPAGSASPSASPSAGPSPTPT